MASSQTTDRSAPQDPLLARLGSGWARWTYEAAMIGLALTVVGLLGQPDRGAVRAINLAIWGVFVADYLLRLGLADDRPGFVRGNLPDLVAILPLDFFRLARIARLARLTRLLRAGSVLWRASRRMRGVMRTNGLKWVLLAAATTVVAGGTLAWAADPTINSFGDGVWWALVTSTTVGYGDLSPVDPVARIAAVVVMFVGIGTIGMLTGSIATYFTTTASRPGPDSAQVRFIRKRLQDWHDLEHRDRRELAAMLEALASRETAAGS